MSEVERLLALADRIAEWRTDDKQGYSEAITLLCAAENALLDAARMLGALPDETKSDENEATA